MIGFICQIERRPLWRWSLTWQRRAREAPARYSVKPSQDGRMSHNNSTLPEDLTVFPGLIVVPNPIMFRPWKTTLSRPISLPRQYAVSNPNRGPPGLAGSLRSRLVPLPDFPATWRSFAPQRAAPCVWRPLQGRNGGRRRCLFPGRSSGEFARYFARSSARHPGHPCAPAGRMERSCRPGGLDR